MAGADPHRYMAPAFEVAIEGSRLGTDLTELAQSVEYESVDGIADEARLTLSNPDYELCNSPLWQAGNEMDLWFGYGAELGYAGRVIIVKPRPRFVSSGIPTIEVKGYTKDQLMMDNKPAREEADIRNFQSDIISDAVERIASKPAYAFDTLDIDPSPPGKFAAAQKADTTDYNYVKSCANTLGWIFWVDHTLEERWTLHFKDPNGLRVQELKYTFEHFGPDDDQNTLLDFDPDLALSGAVTKLQVQSRDPETNELYVEEFEDTEDSPDARYRGDPKQTIDETHTTAGAVVKFFFGDYAVEVVSDKQFKSAADMKVWAQQWWQRKRENFIIGRGTLVGLPDLRARQSHRLVLPERSLVGDYYFARARHSFGSGGYLVDFSGRKLF